MKSKILMCTLLFFSCYSFGQQKNSVAYKVLRVTPNKVFYKNKVIQRKSKIFLKEQPPLVPNIDFFEENKLVFKKNSELVLGKGIKQFILNYHDFEGNPQSKIASLSTNCSTRGFNAKKNSYTCSDDIPNTKFHLLALLGQEKKIKTKECLQQYFSSTTYPINGMDSLLFCKKMNIKSLKFITENDSIFFYVENHRIVIDYKKLPMQDKFTLKAINARGETEFIAKSQTINIKKLIKYALKNNYSKEEIFKILMTDYLYPLNPKNNNLDEKIIKALVVSIKDEES